MYRYIHFTQLSLHLIKKFICLGIVCNYNVSYLTFLGLELTFFSGVYGTCIGTVYMYFPTASEMSCRLRMNILSYRCKVATEHKIT